MRKTVQGVLLAAFVAGWASVAQAGPIINGSFEDPNLGGSWGLYWSIPGWTAVGHQIEIGAGTIYGVTGYDGQQVLELDSTGNAAVAQVVTATGGTYALSFLYAKRNGTSNADNTFQVYWNGALLQTITPTTAAMTLFSTTVDATGNDTLSFVGTGTETTYGGIVDNVQINRVPDSGSALFLCAGGVACLAALRRRSKR